MRIFYNKSKYRFMTTSSSDGPPGYHERKGEPITVLFQINKDVDEEEVGKIYRVLFDDGVFTDAFEDEVVLYGDI